MEQQILILETINKLGYLDTYQISMLLKKSIRTTEFKENLDSLRSYIKDKNTI